MATVKPSDILSYAEDVSAKSLEVARKAYDDLHERAYKLATLLVGGGGAIGSYALGKIVSNSEALEWAPLGVLAAVWLGGAAYVVLYGATSAELSPGNGPDNLRNYYTARLNEAPGSPEAALEVTRNAELDQLQKRLTAYCRGCEKRAAATDVGYVIAAMVAPVAALITALVCQ